MMARMGNPTLSRDPTLASDAGFTLVVRQGRRTKETVHPPPGSITYAGETSTSSLAREFLKRSDEGSSSSTDEEDPNEDSEVCDDGETANSDAEDDIQTPEDSRGERQTHSFEYSDFWKIISARSLMEAMGKKVPLLTVWPGDGTRLQDKIPVGKMGKNPGIKNPLPFSMIRSWKIQSHIIRHHTHWGIALTKMRFDRSAGSPSAWANKLWLRIRSLLKGLPDPIWNPDTVREIYKDGNTVRNRSQRSKRFIELLKTVDGIFFQRFLSYPEEDWNWSSYDNFVLMNLNYLIGDEFIDGEITAKAMTLQTFYALLKQLRKAFKEAAFGGDIGAFCSRIENFGISLREGKTKSKAFGFVSQFLPLYKRCGLEKGNDFLRIAGTLIQTRACGQPPPLVVLQSKRKFILTVSVAPAARSVTQNTLVLAAMENALRDVPSEVFTGLSTKSSISVTSSACWEANRTEGGTDEAIRLIVSDGKRGRPAKILDLETAETLKLSILDELSVGEYVFWRCLEETLLIDPEELRFAYLTVVKEPGKARSVTKARACLKIVLDLVHRIVSWPLAKGFESSTSGLLGSNQAWTLFKDFYKDPIREELFQIKDKEVTEFAGYSQIVETYEDFFMSSTDFEEATDYMDNDVANIIADRWMRQCGIPTVLRGLVTETAFRPRWIFFTAKGGLEDLGLPTSDSDVRKVRLQRGVLMGDPLTKVVLHFTNIVSRSIAELLEQPERLTPYFGNAYSLAGITRDVRSGFLH
jgi:hypothetical protein